MWKHSKRTCQVSRASTETILDEEILTYGEPEEYKLSLGDIPPEEYELLPGGKGSNKTYYVFLYRNDPDLHMDDKVSFGGDEYVVAGDMEQYHLMKRVIISWQQRSSL